MNNEKRIFLFTAVVVFFAAAVSIWWFYPKPELVPDISLKTIDGKQVALNSLRGKTILISFWATSCSTCTQEIPHLVDLYNDMNAEGLEIIGIAMSYDPPNLVLNFSENRNIPYTIALDIDGSAAKAFGNIIATPTNLLIDPDGKVIFKKTGVVDIENLRHQIELLLTKTDTTYS
ncbi:MAG: TlpA family protein disulfide reductase [Proteobacteria bacterium]|nr:TlpA family protein disulfide reductase [Pseudomonadota bacterium]